MSVELKPCPFCRNTKLKIESKHHGTHYYTGTHSASVRCSKCHARGPTASCKVEKGKYHTDEETIQRAADLWNALSREPAIGSCEGCANIAFRYPYASMYPCNNCTRANRKDYYNIKVE
jgi:hypothetical protein